MITPKKSPSKHPTMPVNEETTRDDTGTSVIDGNKSKDTIDVGDARNGDRVVNSGYPSGTPPRQDDTYRHGQRPLALDLDITDLHDVKAASMPRRGAAVNSHRRAGKAPPSPQSRRRTRTFVPIQLPTFIDQAHEHVNDIVGETECCTREASLTRYVHKILAPVRCDGASQGDLGSDRRPRAPQFFILVSDTHINMPHPLADYPLPNEISQITKKDGTKEDALVHCFFAGVLCNVVLLLSRL